MTKAETAMIMAILQAAYPRYYAGQPQSELKPVVSLWHELLQDVPYPVCAAAVKRLIATDEKGYPPVIGQIRAQITAMQVSEIMTENQAWALVARAVRDGAYHAQERFDELPEDVQAAVGSARQLRDWAMLEESEVQTVVASNFQRSYRAAQQRRMEHARLPQDLLLGAQRPEVLPAAAGGDVRK